MSTSAKNGGRARRGQGGKRQFYALNIRYFPLEIRNRLAEHQADEVMRTGDPGIRMSDILVRAIARGLGMRGFDTYVGPTQKLGLSSSEVRAEA